MFFLFFCTVPDLEGGVPTDVASLELPIENPVIAGGEVHFGCATISRPWRGGGGGDSQ